MEVGEEAGGLQVHLEVRLKDAELLNGPLNAAPFAFHEPRCCCCCKLGLNRFSIWCERQLMCSKWEIGTYRCVFLRVWVWRSKERERSSCVEQHGSLHSDSHESIKYIQEPFVEYTWSCVQLCVSDSVCGGACVCVCEWTNPLPNSCPSRGLWEEKQEKRARES